MDIQKEMLGKNVLGPPEALPEPANEAVGSQSKRAGGGVRRGYGVRIFHSHYRTNIDSASFEEGSHVRFDSSQPRRSLYDLTDREILFQTHHRNFEQAT